MRHIDPGLQPCIDECLRCYQVCLSTAMGHCLEAGGRHTGRAHFALMLNCAETCRTSAHAMVLGAEDHGRTCRLCAEICERCADDCEAIGDMAECVAACRRCAESCRTMAR